ncbi:MAG TPA: carboxypeptidase regulatory-like domain-containing protein [Vicinamibacterales bacterium]|nr:carboxypeptidase regulatory-like domain-containing protein [Vicinamibacterales bacterium]
MTRDKKTALRLALAAASVFTVASDAAEIRLGQTADQVVAAAGPPPASRPARDFSEKEIASPTGSGAIEGTVIDLEKKPVRRAHVTIEGTGDVRLNRTTITDEAGHFAVSDLPVGRFTVSAEKTGYPRVSYGASRPFRAGSGIFLQAGQQAKDIVLTLAPGAGFTGVVYDQFGEPRPGVPVQAWEIRTSLSGERTVDSPSAGVETLYTTDEQGRYRIYGLAPGDYVMGTAWFFHGQSFAVRILTDSELRAAFQPQGQSAAPGAGVPAPDSARFDYSPVFSPGVVDPLAAGVMRLEAGEMRTGVDLRMQFQPMSTVEATVSAPDGTQPSARMTLGRRNIADALNTMTVSSSNGGRYRSTSLSPGDYRLSAQLAAADGKPALWAISDFTVSGGQALTLSLFLQPALVVTGAVRFESATAKPPADLSRVSVLLSNADVNDLETARSIDASGALSITGVIPGNYSVRASVPAGIAGGTVWTVKSVLAGGRDVTDRRFEIPSSSVSDLTVTFTDVTTELAGAITTASGSAATDYFVIAIPADRAYWLPQSRRIASTRPDGSGRYQFRALPPGEYRIALTTDLVTSDLRDMSTLDRLAAQSVGVTIAVGDRKTLDLRAGR